MKPINIGFVIDPIELLNPKKDSTLALMLEAQGRGWIISYFTLNDIGIINGKTRALIREVNLYENKDKWFEITKEYQDSLANLDIIFMRKDPPFDIEYIIATYVLAHAQDEGVFVINDPKSLRDCNEKVFVSKFPNCSPKSIISRSKNEILDFVDTNNKIVVKPLDKMGGSSVFIISKGDPNCNVIIEEITANETKFIQGQVYVDDIKTTGDKRIILINGEPVEKGIARIPQGDDHRGNMAVGAKVEGYTLNDRDFWICDQLRDELRARQLIFVGIDIIGDYLTEINVTSPTGIKEISKLFDLNVPKMVLDSVEKLYHENKVSHDS